MSSEITTSSSSRLGARSVHWARSRMPAIARFAWATVFCNVAVVLWGAYVRATGSGAGCGNKWPVCGGEVLGAGAKTQTVIEFTHRATSGIALLMVGILAVWCWRATAKRDWARYSAVLAAVFLANEALLGAALVLFGHVAQDKSAGRILFLCLHFGNTLLLLAMLALTAHWLQGVTRNCQLVGSLPRIVAISGGMLATMLIGISGALAALGDTLFPATSLRAAFEQEFGSGAPTLLHLRVVHPILAVTGTAYALWAVFTTASKKTPRSKTAIGLAILFVVQIGIGILNVVLLTPVWLQIVHLCVADLVWILLVLVSADLLLESSSASQGKVVAA